MTMTLEELRADLATWQPRRTHDLSTIDAAIRERNELRTAVRFGKLCADAGADYKVRAEKAEAELAALKWRRGAGACVDAPDAIREVELLHFVESFAK